MLTRKQHELLLFINERLSRGGVSPSFDEMKEALGLKSKSGIHRLITGLEERGFIRRLAHRARALEVVRLPEEAGVGRPRRPDGAAGFAPNVIRGNFSGALPGAPVGDASESVQLPLYGRIAAGTPIEALRDSTNSIPVPAFLLKKGDHYALEVDRIRFGLGVGQELLEHPEQRKWRVWDLDVTEEVEALLIAAAVVLQRPNQAVERAEDGRLTERKELVGWSRPREEIAAGESVVPGIKFRAQPPGLGRVVE